MRGRAFSIAGCRRTGKLQRIHGWLERRGDAPHPGVALPVRVSRGHPCRLRRLRHAARSDFALPRTSSAPSSGACRRLRRLCLRRRTLEILLTDVRRYEIAIVLRRHPHRGHRRVAPARAARGRSPTLAGPRPGASGALVVFSSSPHGARAHADGAPPRPPRRRSRSGWARSTCLSALVGTRLSHARPDGGVAAVRGDSRQPRADAARRPGPGESRPRAGAAEASRAGR